MEEQLTRIADAFESIASSLEAISNGRLNVCIEDFLQADGESVRVMLLNQSIGLKSYPFGISIEEDQP
jgi:hypothetical protein